MVKLWEEKSDVFCKRRRRRRSRRRRRREGGGGKDEEEEMGRGVRQLAERILDWGSQTVGADRQKGEEREHGEDGDITGRRRTEGKEEKILTECSEL